MESGSSGAGFSAALQRSHISENLKLVRHDQDSAKTIRAITHAVFGQGDR
jgi:hypothetical protein